MTPRLKRGMRRCVLAVTRIPASRSDEAASWMRFSKKQGFRERFIFMTVCVVKSTHLIFHLKKKKIFCYSERKRSNAGPIEPRKRFGRWGSRHGKFKKSLRRINKDYSDSIMRMCRKKCNKALSSILIALYSTSRLRMVSLWLGKKKIKQTEEAN